MVPAALFNMIAAAVSRSMEFWETRRATKDIPREDLPSTPEMKETPSDPRFVRDGQITGVVVPKLEHKETLRSMENILAASTEE